MICLRPFTAEFQASILLFEDIINIDLQINNDINADYLVGEDANANSFGVTTGPQNQQSWWAINVTLQEHLINAETGGANDRRLTTIHEIGHSLGLAHPHGADAGTTDSGDANTAVAPYQWHHTMMSYTPPPNVMQQGDPMTGAGSEFGRTAVPMALDIAALQNMYGANMTTRTGNSTYTLTDAMSAPLDTTGDTISVGRAYYSIWDAGGTDTIQYGGAARVIINLNTATLSNMPPADVAAVTAELQASPRLRDTLGRGAS